MLLPEQIVAVPANVTVGAGDTLIVATFDTTAVHGEVVTRTVYELLATGDKLVNAVAMAAVVVAAP